MFSELVMCLCRIQRTNSSWYVTISWWLFLVSMQCIAVYMFHVLFALIIATNVSDDDSKLMGCVLFILADVLVWTNAMLRCCSHLDSSGNHFCLQYFDTVGCLSGRVSGMQKVVLLQLPKVSVETMSQTVQHISPIKPVSASSLAFSNNV